MKRLMAIAVVALMGAAGSALAQEGEGVIEEEFTGTYDENMDDDWFFDEYDTGGGEGWTQDEEWFEHDSYYGGVYDDESPGDDWYYDAYETDVGTDGGWLDWF